MRGQDWMPIESYICASLPRIVLSAYSGLSSIADHPIAELKGSSNYHVHRPAGCIC